MMILTAKDKNKLREKLLMDCIDKDGRINPELLEKFLEEVARIGFDYCEEKMEEDLQALEGRKREREKREEEES